jgi:hypothetical protein
MTGQPDQELIDAINGFTGMVSSFREELQSAIAAGDKRVAAESKKRDRRQSLWIIADILVTVVATIATGFSLQNFFAIQAANDRAVAEHQDQVAACRTGNILRAKQKTALDNILGNGKTSSKVPPAQQREIEALLARDHEQVAAGWSQLNCPKLYRTGRSPSAIPTLPAPTPSPR